MKNRESFNHQYGPWCVVAGASTGIGESFSRLLAEQGLNLVLIALPETKLSELSQSLESQYGIDTLVLELDLADPDSFYEFKLLTSGLEIGLLVYVACCSVIGEFLDVSLEDKMRIVDVNVKAPIQYASLLAPPMVERGKGGIILMSSLSAAQGTAMVSTYAATKAFNTVLAEGLWSELNEKGVDVLGFMAGATHTPTFDELTPAHKQKSVLPMQANEVAEQALLQLGKGPTKVAGIMNQLIHFVTGRLLSRRAAVRFISYNTKRVYQD